MATYLTNTGRGTLPVEYNAQKSAYLRDDNAATCCYVMYCVNPVIRGCHHFSSAPHTHLLYFSMIFPCLPKSHLSAPNASFCHRICINTMFDGVGQPTDGACRAKAADVQSVDQLLTRCSKSAPRNMLHIARAMVAGCSAVYVK